jgi:bacterioferritin
LVAERCAVVRYQKICEMTHGNDYETYHMAVKILHEELEHEEEILSFKNDINALFEYKNEMQA